MLSDPKKHKTAKVIIEPKKVALFPLRKVHNSTRCMSQLMILCDESKRL